MREALAAPAHGGDISSVAGRYGDGDWLDFSANINPAGPPPSVLAALRAAANDAELLVHYPSAQDRALREALSRRWGWDPAQVVIGNGAAALIEAFVRVVVPRRCLVPQPAFSEYGRALAAQGCETVALRLDPRNDFALDVDALIGTLGSAHIDACIITNPHNPSGSLTPRADVMRIVAAAREHGVALLIDEAFIDYAPHASVVRDVLSADDDVLVLRSLTKFYAIPGLRVGYGVASARFAHAVATRVPSWPVTSLAAVAAIAAIGDEGYEHASRLQNEVARIQLAQELAAAGARVLPSAANFLLIETPIASAAMTEGLAERRRIIVRDCSTYPTLETAGFVRVAVRSDADNARLTHALRRELGSRA